MKAAVMDAKMRQSMCSPLRKEAIAEKPATKSGEVYCSVWAAATGMFMAVMICVMTTPTPIMDRNRCRCQTWVENGTWRTSITTTVTANTNKNCTKATSMNASVSRRH